MTKVDIKDAYYSVPINVMHQKFLKCAYGGKLYQFTCLPNGLCSGPRKFTKLLKPSLACNIVYYLITISTTFSSCFDNIRLCVSLA